MTGCVRDPSSSLSTEEIECLKLTQSVISRMANNSEKTKTVFISLSGGFAAISGITSISPSWKISLCFCIISIVLWYIDARYLRLERLFRVHYQRIISGSNPRLVDWQMDISKYESEVSPKVKTMISSFSMLIYPVIIVLIIILTLH